jgi:hypothetical protein
LRYFCGDPVPKKAKIIHSSIAFPPSLFLLLLRDVWKQSRVNNLILSRSNENTRFNIASWDRLDRLLDYLIDKHGIVYDRIIEVEIYEAVP